MVAGNAIGSGADALETRVVTLSARAGAGGIFLSEADALNIGDTAAAVQRVNPDGSVTLLADGTQADLRTIAGDGSIVVSSQSGPFVLNDGTVLPDGASGGDSTAIATSGAGNVLLQTVSGALTLNAGVDAGAGNITLLASAAITQAAPGDLFTTGGTIDVQSSAGAIVMADGAQALSNAGNIRYRAATDISLGLLDARSTADRTLGSLSGQASWGSVSVSSVSGSITDNAETAVTVDIYARELRINTAALAGGAGAGANHLESEVLSVSASVGTGGLFMTESSAITVGQTGAITVARVRSDGTVAGSSVGDAQQSDLMSAGAVVLQSTAGSIVISEGDVDPLTLGVSAAGNILLKAGGVGSDLVLEADVLSSAGNISLNAAQDVVHNADLASAALGKSIDLVAGRNIVMAQGTLTQVNNANIVLQAAGSITLETLLAGTGNVQLIATGGSIIDGDAAGDAELDITAAGLVLRAASAIGSGANHLESSVGTLSAATGAGGLFITESEAITVGALTVNVQRVDATGASAPSGYAAQEDLASTGAGAIVLNLLAGDIVIGAGSGGAGVLASGAGNVLLQTVSGALTLNAGVDAGAGNITLLASAAITQAAPGDLFTTGGTIDVQSSAGAIVMADGAQALSNAGNIRYRAATDISLGLLDARSTADRTLGSLSGQASWGSVSVSSVSGSITDNAETAVTVDIYARELRINTAALAGGAGAGANHLESEVLSVSASVGTGGLFMTESSAITVGQTGAITVARVRSDGTVAGSSVGDAQQSDLMSAGAVVLQSTAGSIVISEGDVDPLTLGVSAAGNILLKAGGVGSDLVLEADVLSSAGNISLNAAQDVVHNADLASAALGKSIDLVAGRNIVMAQGTLTQVNNANIVLQAAGSITLETLLAGTGNVQLIATGGSIIDGDAAGDAELDITAAGLVLRAASAIGSGANHLESSVGTLSAATGAGGLFITESEAITVGALTVNVQRVDATGASAPSGYAAQEDLASTGAGAIVLNLLAGDIVIGAGSGGAGVLASGAGNVLLQTLGAGADILANASIVSAGGHLSLLAADALVIADGTEINTELAGSIFLQAGTGALTQADNSRLSSNNGDIRVVAGTRITLGGVSSNARVSLIAVSGSIVDAGNSSGFEDVNAAELRMVAGAAIGTALDPIELGVGTLSARAGDGGIYLQEADALRIGDAAAAVQRVNLDNSLTLVGDAIQADVRTIAGDGAIMISTVAGSLVLGDGTVLAGGAVGADGIAVSASGRGNVRLQAGGTGSDLTLEADLLSGAGYITLLAGNSVRLEAGADVTASTIYSIDVQASGGAVIQADDSRFTASAGDIRIMAGTGITLGGLRTNARASLLAGSGPILDAGNSFGGEDLVAESVRLLAGSGIGSGDDAIETRVGGLSARAGGGIFLTEADALSIGDAGAGVQRVNPNNSLTPISDAIQADVRSTAANGAIVLSTMAGSITLNDGSVLTSGVAGSDNTALSGSGNILLWAGGPGSDIVLNADIVSASGNISVRAANTLNLAGAADITTGGTGGIDVEAIAGAVTQADNSRFTSSTGDIRLQSGTSITLGGLTTAARASLIAAGGSIIDAGSAFGAEDVHAAS